MSLETLGTPAPPAAPDTYSLEDELTEDYTTTAGTVSGTMALEMRMRWPTVDDVTVPRFLVIRPILGGWATSNPIFSDSESTWVTGMGGIYAALQCRTQSNDPLSTGDDAGHLALRRTIRSAPLDVDTALKYILANYIDGDGGTMPAIEPQWIFYMGTSAAGVTCHLHSQTFPTRKHCGLITCVSGYGMDGTGTSPNTATDIVRDQLKFSYRHHKVPTCAFLGGADTTLGSDRIQEFRTHLNSRPESIVHYDADGGHADSDFGDFDVSALVGADTVEEAVYNFVRARCAATQPTHVIRRNFRTWPKNWVKLQSRFW